MWEPGWLSLLAHREQVLPQKRKGKRERLPALLHPCPVSQKPLLEGQRPVFLESRREELCSEANDGGVFSLKWGSQGQGVKTWHQLGGKNWKEMGLGIG